jgi:hypothetical protein
MMNTSVCHSLLQRTRTFFVRIGPSVHPVSSQRTIPLSAMAATMSRSQWRHHLLSHKGSVCVSSTDWGDQFRSYSVSSAILNTNNGQSIQRLSIASSISENFAIPKRTRQKIICASDAVSLIRSGDTLYVSGFVTQGCAELILQELGKRYDETGEPHSLTLLFGGGPGDYKSRGLNHLAKMTPKMCANTGDSIDSVAKPMLKRTIGGHYGQVPSKLPRSTSS